MILKKIYKPDSLVAFVDQVGFNHRINPLYAWSAKGKETRIKIKIGTAKQNKNKSEKYIKSSHNKKTIVGLT